ncbi:MAG: SpoIIE family protein phosphatase [Planctomycetaceae bacterium]|nr:SpoIIE family protein phosphatase [Planctomycetaceae bacterium]
MAHLRAKKNTILKDETFPLSLDTTVLGRHPYCEVVLDHGAVSREHARISRNKSRYCVEDLHSRNGTYLNGKQIERKQPLFNGDVIRVCDLEFVFYSDSMERPPTASDSCIETGQQVMFDDSPIREPRHITSQIPVGMQGASSIRRKKAYSREKKFRAMVDLGRNLGFQADETVPKLTQNLLKYFPKADCAYFFLKDEGSNQFVLQSFKHRDPNFVSDKLHISRSTLEKAAATKVAILSDDVSGDSWFDGNQSLLDFQLCSIMVTPLLDFNRDVFGIVQLDSRSTGKRFDSDDLDMLVDISHQITISYENMRYYEKIAQERALEREMSVAHKVQKGFLPIQPPKVENYGFFDYYQPAQYLGGDYFDYVTLPDGRLVVALGDVSGKGVPAALLMAKLSSEVRYSLVAEATPADAMHRLNAIFCEERWDSRFITFLLTLIDTKTNTVTMLNAGHNPPLLCDICTNDETTDLDRPRVREIAGNLKGLPLGVSPDASYEQLSFGLAQGQMIAIYSDGLTDAMNTEGQTYDLARIQEMLTATRAATVDAIGRGLIDSIRQFSANVPQADDQCLVLFGRF